MTESSLGSSFSWWIGKVVNVKDPDQSGRVQVRVFGRHDDTKNIPDDDLPWAMPLQPVTSAAIGKVGTSPLGLLKDSKVVGFWADSDQQYPVIMGSFGKAGDPVEGSSSDGAEKIDIKTGSIPSAAVNQSDPVEYNAFSKLYANRVDINTINNKGAEPTIGKFTTTTGVVNKKEVDTKLKEPEKPTTASADKTDKSDVLDIVSTVDPDKKSRALPGAVDGFKNVRNIIQLTGAIGLKAMLSVGILKAFSSLSGKFGSTAMLGVALGLCKSGAIGGIAGDALKIATTGLILSAVANNGKIPQQRNTLIVPAINPLIGRPPNNLISNVIPETYVQQYYPLNREPYPGYIQYKDLQTGAILYKLRARDDYHFESAQNHIHYKTSSLLEIQIGAALAVGLGSALLGKGSGVDAIGKALTGGLDLTRTMGIAAVLGHGVNPMNMVGLAGKLIPNIAKNVQGVTGNHLPKSVLDTNKVGATMSEFTKNQALLAQKKNNMNTALKPDIDSKLAEANKKLAASEIAKNGPAKGSSEMINYNGTTYKVTY